MSPRPTSAIAGWSVLVPRAGLSAGPVSALLGVHGAHAVEVEMLAFDPAKDRAPLDRARARLLAGAYDWVMVTSGATAAALAAAQVAVPPATRIAAVGGVTQCSLRNYGFDVAYTATGPASGASLVDQWQNLHGVAAPARVLVFQSNLAGLGLRDRLLAFGHSADVVVAYTTVERAVAPEVVDEVLGGGLDAVLVTSGSVARALVAALGTLAPGVAVVAIGPATTIAARAAGMRVDVTASVASMAGLVEALVAHAESRLTVGSS